jgi:hypothetical protein
MSSEPSVAWRMSRCTRMPRSNLVASNVPSVVKVASSLRHVRPPSSERRVMSLAR